MMMGDGKLQQNLPFSKSGYVNCDKKKMKIINLQQNR